MGNTWKLLLATIVALGVGLTGCWDDPDHRHESEDTSDQGCPPLLTEKADGWGAACETHGDCVVYGYSQEARCVQNVVEIINTPNGLCTACCNEPGSDVCGPGVDCVGVDQVFLACLARCESDEECRTDEGYVCRQIPFVESDFPCTYCLPSPEFQDVDPNQPATDPECDWPWT